MASDNTLEIYCVPAAYHLLEQISEYNGHELKLTVWYSESLKATKMITVNKAVVKETELILKVQRHCQSESLPALTTQISRWRR